MKTDVYEKITGQIVAELEKGVRPWHMPWAAGHVAGPVSRPLRANGKPYSGINVLMLWVTAMERGYSAPIWMTYRQAAELGAHVRKGEKGALVVYASKIRRTSNKQEEAKTELSWSLTAGRSRDGCSTRQGDHVGLGASCGASWTAWPDGEAIARGPEGSGRAQRAAARAMQQMRVSMAGSTRASPASGENQPDWHLV